MMTRNKIVLIAIVVVLAVVAGIFAYSDWSAKTPSPENVTPAPAASPTTTAEQTSPAAGIAMADVAKHSTSADCWTVVRGNVYDLTSWIAKHPGGREAIIKLCGKDGTDKFVGKHGGQDGPEAALVSFKIGALAK